MSDITDEITNTPGEIANNESDVIGIGEEDHHFVIRLGSTDYSVDISPEQWRRIGMIIRPKPVPSETDRAVITADHIASVGNTWQLLLNRCVPTIADHDCRKLQQTEEEHHKLEPHHWPLDGYDTSLGYLPLQFVAEAVCDYFATVFGRALAGRGLDWMSPTNHITAGDVLTSTVLDLLIAYDLATVTPAPNTQGVSE